MAKKVAINGFGRIGRNTLRAAVKEGIFDKIDYSAVVVCRHYTESRNVFHLFDSERAQPPFVEMIIGESVEIEVEKGVAGYHQKIAADELFAVFYRSRRA